MTTGKREVSMAQAADAGNRASMAAVGSDHVRRGARAILVLLAAVALAGCAGPRPVLYPNEQLRAVGQAQADRDIAECRQMAEAAGTSPGADQPERAAGGAVTGGAIGGATGAAGGAVLGRPGTGAAVGAATGATASFMRGLFSRPQPSGAHRGFVDRCLRERGYEPVGWE
jgi:hypothetical protein